MMDAGVRAAAPRPSSGSLSARVVGTMFGESGMPRHGLEMPGGPARA